MKFPISGPWESTVEWKHVAVGVSLALIAARLLHDESDGRSKDKMLWMMTEAAIIPPNSSHEYHLDSETNLWEEKVGCSACS